MQPLHTFNVVPKLPAELEALRDLVFNLWWTWEPQARGLFRHLDPELWHRTNHNPLRMLQLCRQKRLEEVAGDDDFLREMRTVHRKFRAYPKGNPVVASEARREAMQASFLEVNPFEVNPRSAPCAGSFRSPKRQKQRRSEAR